MGESSKHRNKIINLILVCNHGKIFFESDILDIGCGADPIFAGCDKLDLQNPYTKNCAIDGLTYRCDARYVSKYVKKKYGVVYSSHLLEDFPREFTIDVIKEWLLLVKNEGILIILGPDQRRYENYCKINNEKPNEHHQIPEFGLKYVEDCFGMIDCLRIVYKEELFDNGDYNFLIAAKKNV